MDGTLNEIMNLNGIPSNLEDIKANLDKLGGPESEPHYPVGWAWAGNTPFQFSTGFSSGDLGGNGRSVMLSGTASRPETCQPAWSRTSTAWASGATASLISARCACIASVSAKGMTRAAPLPSLGQIAPKM